MSKEIANSKAADIATNTRLWLLNTKNGRILSWTPILATNKDYIDCLPDGTPVRAGDVPGNHPWIRRTANALRNRLGANNASDETIKEFGDILTERGNEKFKALVYDKVKAVMIENNPEATGPMIRIVNNIERRVKEAKADLRLFSMRIRSSLGL